MIVQLLTEHHLEFLSLKAGCRGSSEVTLVKMSNCWKSHAAAQIQSPCREANHVSTHMLMVVSVHMSCDMWFPAMRHFDKSKLRRVCAS